MDDRIAVLGVGGIGGAIGAYLTREGHDVTLIDQWAAHMEAIKADGLTLTDANQEFTVAAKALQLSDVSSLRPRFDIVFLSVKSYDTLWMTHFIAPYLTPSGFILPAMNGLNDETVASVVSYPRTVGCVTTISAGVYEPGHVVRTDPTTAHAFSVGELSGIITPRVEAVVEALQVMGPSEATQNIWGARWSKMIWNCMGNALAGLMGPTATALDDDQRDLFGLVRVATGAEAARVALALGIAFSPSDRITPPALAAVRSRKEAQVLILQLARVNDQRRLTSEQAHHIGTPGRPSLLQDVIKGRRTEVDYLNGKIVKEGERLGVPTPVNSAIVELMRELESGQVRPGVANLQRLAPYLPF